MAKTKRNSQSSYKNLITLVMVFVCGILILFLGLLITTSSSISIWQTNAQSLNQGVIKVIPSPLNRNSLSKEPTATINPDKKTTLTTITAVGDSILVGASPDLKKIYGDKITINARVGRQVKEGIQILNDLQKSRMIGDQVVVGLGTNGTFTKQQFTAIMSLLSDKNKVVIVTNKAPRTWISSNNQMMRANAPLYKNTILFDWNAVSSKHGEYFVSDGIHLTNAGIKAYVRELSKLLP